MDMDSTPPPSLWAGGGRYGVDDGEHNGASPSSMLVCRRPRARTVRTSAWSADTEIIGTWLVELETLFVSGALRLDV